MRGQIPGAVAHHLTVVAGKNMYLIGGVMDGHDYNQRVMYRLDLQTLSWDRVRTTPEVPDRGDQPVQIDEHTVCVDGTQVIVFGGFEDGARTNKVRTFNLETHRWALIESQSAKGPKPRAGHSASFFDNSMYIFGGKDDENFKLDDFWRFDMTSKTWTPIEPVGGPSARAGHTAIVY